MQTERIAIAWRGRSVEIEAGSSYPTACGRAPVVFLHEGLGSIAVWCDFPARLRAALSRPGWVYSRPGHG